MDNTLFYKSFGFWLLSAQKSRHTDNARGIDCHFLARMLRGTARFVTCSGEEMEVAAGDVFYLPLGLCYHSYWTPDRGGVEWESYAFLYFPDKSGRQYAMQKLDANAALHAHLNALAADMRVSPSSVSHLYAALGEALPRMRETDHDPRRDLYAKARSYIHAHPDLRVSDLARHCGMSESGLYAFFRSYANTTPIAEKNRMLARRAIALLASTDLSVEEISDRVGFQSVAYFRKILRAETGKTPTELRRERSSKFNL
ncbi:MAG: helix-turn-helix transcriptional regulator [Ruminococcaceae bacterium]|nr:helix-turn-helix transcriptional regulator [Oscillospiraceae bacterium]